MTKKKQKLSKEEVRATRDFYQSNLILLNCLESITLRRSKDIGSQAVINFELHKTVDSLLSSKTLSA